MALYLKEANEISANMAVAAAAVHTPFRPPYLGGLVGMPPTGLPLPPIDPSTTAISPVAHMPVSCASPSSEGSPHMSSPVLVQPTPKVGF